MAKVVKRREAVLPWYFRPQICSRCGKELGQILLCGACMVSVEKQCGGKKKRRKVKP